MFRSLHIDGYRAFSHFSMEGLKQINLLVGGNNSGKTSVLEALYLLTAAGDIQAIWQVVSQRGERLDIDTPVRSSREDEVDISHLFHGHELRQGVAFSISSKNKEPDRFLKFEVREASQQEIRDDSQGELYLPDGGETMGLRSVLVLTGNPRSSLAGSQIEQAWGSFPSSR